jgi:hypothetical protein
MGTVFLLLDDEHKECFDCSKFLVSDEALAARSFEEFLTKVNDDDPPPDVTNRYQVNVGDAARLYAFCVRAAGKARVVGDCWDDPKPDWSDAIRTYEMVDTLDKRVRRGICGECGRNCLLTDDPLCAQCDWK